MSTTRAIFWSFIIFATALMLLVAMGCEPHSALNIPRNPDALADHTVYDPMPTYGDKLIVSASEIRPVQMPPDDHSDWAAFKAWKANTDPTAPLAVVRRWLRGQD